MRKLENRINNHLVVIEGFFADSEYTEASFYWSTLSTEMKQISSKTLAKNVSKETLERWFRSYYTVRLPSLVRNAESYLAKPEIFDGYHDQVNEQLVSVRTRIQDWMDAGRPNQILESHK